jgi:hypothetical protein
MNSEVRMNLFGERDLVQTRQNGKLKVVLADVALQLTIEGEAEVATTKRNPFTDAREREDERKGLTAR